MDYNNMKLSKGGHDKKTNKLKLALLFQPNSLVGSVEGA